MNDLKIAAMRQALEALYQAREHVTVHTDGPWQRIEQDCHAAITALREHMAESERDWSMLEATQESLREHMAEIHRLRAALAQQALPVEPVAEFLGRRLTPQGATEFWGVMLCDPMQDPPKGTLFYTAPPQQSEPVYYEVSSVVTHNLWMRVSKSQYDEYVRSGWAGRTLHAVTQQNITDSNKDNRNGIL